MALTGEGQRRLQMHLILGADQHRVGQLAGVGGQAPVGEDVFRRDGMLRHKLLAVGVTRFRYRHHLHQIGMRQRIARVDFAARTGADHQHPHRAMGKAVGLC